SFPDLDSSPAQWFGNCLVDQPADQTRKEPENKERNKERRKPYHQLSKGEPEKPVLKKESRHDSFHPSLFNSAVQSRNARQRIRRYHSDLAGFRIIDANEDDVSWSAFHTERTDTFAINRKSIVYCTGRRIANSRHRFAEVTVHEVLQVLSKRFGVLPLLGVQLEVSGGRDIVTAMHNANKCRDGPSWRIP